MEGNEKDTNNINKKNKIIIIISVVFVILLLSSILGYKIWRDIKISKENAKQVNVEEVVPKQEKVEEVDNKSQSKIFKGSERPIAVMIDNHSGAWPQAGLDKAYMVYEIIVEGGETRLMAVFKGQDIDNIGPIRSSRHYFLDYALENDAIYVHYGWSPQAKSDISRLSVNNINGIYYGNSNFRRVKTKKAPHNVMTSTDKILSIAKNSKYRTTSNEESVLNYSSEEVKLNDGIDAENIKITHSYLHSVKYEYDSKTKRYTRYARGKLQKDYTSGGSLTTKNIIIECVKNSALNDGSGKDRQIISNIGTFDGYYITNGKAIKIKCTKKSRDSKTVYKDIKGNIISVNDGNTWINLCPSLEDISIK